MVDGQAAVVGAAAAGRERCLELQVFDLVKGEHGRLLPAVVPFTRDQRGAERAHDPGDIGAGDLPAGDHLDAAQDGVIVECTALDDDIFTQLGGVRDFDDLEQGIFDHGIGEAGGNIGHIRAFLLRLFDARIHKDRAARAQVDGMRGKQGRFRKVLHGVVQGFREGLDEGAATGGAGFVEQHVVDGVVFDPDTLHVLSADVQDTVDLRVEKGRRVVVGDGLDFALVQKERGLEKGFAVTGRAAADDPGVRGKQAAELCDRRNGSPDRAAVIIGIEGVEQGPVLPDEGKLRGRGTRVDAQEAVAVVIGDLPALHTGFLMPSAEFVIFLLCGKQGIHAPDLKLHMELPGETVRHFR